VGPNTMALDWRCVIEVTFPMVDTFEAELIGRADPRQYCSVSKIEGPGYRDSLSCPFRKTSDQRKVGGGDARL